MLAGALSKAERHRSNLQRYLSTSPHVSCQESLILQGNKRKRAASLLKGTLSKTPRSHAIFEVIALVTRYSIRCERPFAKRMTSHRFGVSRGVQPLLKGTLSKTPRSHAISEVIALVTRYSIRCERPFAKRMTSHRFGVSRGVQPLLERGSKGVSPLSVLPPKRSYSLAEAPSPCTPLPQSLRDGHQGDSIRTFPCLTELADTLGRQQSARPPEECRTEDDEGYHVQ